MLFGDDLGEFAANQALADLPKWLTDGYIAYAAENWSPRPDDDLAPSCSMAITIISTSSHLKAFVAGHSFGNM